MAEALVAQTEKIPHHVLRDQQRLQIATLPPQEKVPRQVHVIREVDPQPECEIKVHQIDSDIDEETRNPTFPVNIYL